MKDDYWKSLNFLNDLIEQIPAGIFWKDKNSVFLGCNHFFARLAAIDDPNDIIGKTDFDLPWANYQAQLYVDDDKEVITTQQPKLDIEEYQTLSDGSECVLLTNKIPLFNKEGDVVGILGIFHDITRRKKMEMQLELSKNKAEMASLAKTEFIANMSHDIRTPLTGVMSLSHYLYEKLYDENARQFAQMIFESGQQLLSLLNNILDIVASDNLQQNDLALEAFYLPDMIDDIIKINKPAIVTKYLNFVLEYDPSLNVTVLGDRSKLLRVLLNLFSNAIKFTNQGEIKFKIECISLNEQQVTIEFRIIDSGIGIPTDLQLKVFDRFYRAHPSYNGVYKGHGIGLHIARTFIELMGGEIFLESTSGSGSTFYFQLTMDLIMNERMQSAQMNLENSKIVSSKPTLNFIESNHTGQQEIQLMLVEDNKIARKMIEIFSEQLNYQLDCFESVEKAIDSYQRKQYDLIITDIGLPDQSGYELAEWIRTFERQSGKQEVPIIGLTAHAHFSVKTKCLHAGMQDVLHKPMSMDLLKSITAAYCNHQPQMMDTKTLIREEQLHLNYHYYEKFQLFNLEKALSRIQCSLTLKEMVLLFLQQDLIHQLDTAHAAFEQGQYPFLLELIHKIRGGAVYCCTERLYKACESMENILMNEQEIAIKTLFPTWAYVMHQTIHQLQLWLTENYV